ncbi:hypothetical protein BJS_08998 [Bradyrhizobium japonicum SEMIA 5079]|nr:hypothetical protein BJS_08998 [Bradyrhizobium japonicum SEMIA 5079]
MRPYAGLLVILVFVVLIFVVFHFQAVERGQRQRLAEKIAFRAHPEAEDVVAFHLCDGQRLAAGFQHHDVAGFQFHGWSFRG